MDRRRFLDRAAVGFVLGVAGCAGDGDGADDGSPSTADPTATATTDPTATATTDPTTTTRVPTVVGEPTTATVELRGSAFTPLRLSVDPPVTVEWVNRDPYAHNVKSAAFHETAAEWDYFSGNYGEGESASHTFRRPGVYEYFCTIHGTGAMCGAVLVGDVSLDASLPCE
ncbi:cupredoxin domain-containing protein [Halobaculum gomorrense]|uniref:Plastocyanin n=1 Tax=Halobaculum gomorrense TaxID=43928 RepID=A0A1M5N3M9_9EURY|nr:plastocyanin/azurin family copper-binding protein [Halobaculum gomorrense]SHG84186.1 Plastocyanin [Halobaculum gomorrense]